MKKLAALMFVALAAFTAHAGYELRSSIADENGIFMMELVNTETQEVLETRRFQHIDTGTTAYTSFVPVDGEGSAQDTKGIGGDVSSGGDDPITSDEVDHAISADGTGSVHTTEKVGAWDAVHRGLLSLRETLQESLRTLEGYYTSRANDESADTAEASDATTTLVVPPEVVEYTEEAAGQATEVVPPKI